MLRILAFVVALALLVAGAVWLADRPGAVAVDWLGWRLETSVPVLLLALGLLAAALTWCFGLIARLARWPGRWTMRRRETRLRNGYLALSDGLAAAAGGEEGKARKLAGRAEKLLGDPTLTRVLSAQAAQLAGDSAGARDHFEAMLERPETAALGLRGLLSHALETGDQEKAIDLATRARRANPSDPWLVDTLFRLLVKTLRWRDAEALLTDAIRRKAMAPAEAAHRRALVLTERASRAATAADRRSAEGLARQAVAADPRLTAAALQLAGLYGQSGKTRRAAALLERAWAEQPAAGLAEAYGALWPADDPLQRLRRLEKLVKGRPDDALAHRALGEASLEAKLWGQARKHLLAALDILPSAGIYRLLARLEEAEYKNLAAARSWLDKAQSAPPDPTWCCRDCGTVAALWSLACPHCGEIDSLVWGQGRPAPAAVTAAAAR